MRILLLFYFVFSWVSVYAQNKCLAAGEAKIQYLNLFNKKNPGIACFRIPALVTAPNGDLIAAIDERVPSCGNLKYSRDINIVIRRSSDNGKTWSAIQTVVNYSSGQ